MAVTRYLDTFFRHKVLLCAPVVLALFVSAAYVTSRPQNYMTTATLWVDTPLATPSSLDTTGFGPTPSAQAQALFQELLATRDFASAAGRRGPLAAYLSAKVGRGPALDDALMGTLQRSIAVSVAGPQVLRVTMMGPDPRVAVGALDALVQQYFDEVTSVRRDRGRAAVDFYQEHLSDAAAALAKARQAEVDYINKNPQAVSLVATDPQFASLAQASTVAQTQYDAAKSSFDQANQSLKVAATATGRVIDPPTGAVPVGSRKKKVFAIFAGLLFGVFLSTGALVALTAADTAARRKEDIEGIAPSLELVATIDHVGGQPALRGRSS